MTFLNMHGATPVARAWLRPWAAPNIEFVVAEGVNAGSWSGLAAMAEAWRDYLQVWEGWLVEVEEYRELDDERVLVLGRRRGRGKMSGVEVGRIDERTTSLLHVREGKVTRLVLNSNRDSALADLGLTPERDAQ